MVRNESPKLFQMVFGVCFFLRGDAGILETELSEMCCVVYVGTGVF